MKKICTALLVLSLLMPYAAQAAPQIGGLQGAGRALTEDEKAATDMEAATALINEALVADDEQAGIALVLEAAQLAVGNTEILLTCAQLLYYYDAAWEYSEETEEILRQAVAASSDGERNEALQMLAEHLLYDERPEEAIDLMTEAVENAPEDESFQVTLAAVYFYSGRSDEALETLENLLEDSPKLFDAYSLRAAIFYSECRWDEAIAAYQKLDEQFPEYFDGLYGLYQTYLASGQFERAIRVIDDVIRYGGDDAMWVERARIRLWKLYDPEAALKEADSLLRVNPDWIDAQVIRIGAYIMLGQYEDALAVADILEEMDADYADLMRGIVAMNDERWADAEKIFMEITERVPDNYTAWQYRGATHIFGYDDLAGTMSALSEAFALTNGYGDTDLYITLGQAYRSRGGLLEAARAFAQADMLTYDDPRPLYYLVVVLADAGRINDVLDILTDMEQRYPGWYETMLARILVEDMLGNSQKAVDAFEAFAAKFPYGASTLVTLEGTLRAAAGQAEGTEMIEAWLAETECENALDWDAYAYALVQAGELDAAQEALDKAEAYLAEDDPQHARTVRDTRISIETTRAELLLARGDMEGCIKAYKEAAALGWPLTALASYSALKDVYTSDAYQALLDEPAQQEIWDLSILPVIPVGEE